MPSTSLHRQSAIDGWPVRKAKPLHQLPRLIPTPRVLRSEGRPISMTSTQVTKKSVPGTVVAAECCYGTRLYDPSLRRIPDPICIAYLTAGALGFLGSTNFAYDPETWNGQADLLTQFFFENVARSTSCNARRAIHSRTRRSTNSSATRSRPKDWRPAAS